MSSEPAVSTPVTSPQDLLVGLATGLGAQAIWGLSIAYFKEVQHLSPLTVVAHRALWGLPLIVALALLSGGLPRLKGLLADRSALPFIPLSAVLLAVNWLGFVYCVVSGQVLQAALAYFITPLMMAALGVFVLKERLRLLQKIGLGLSAAGMLLLVASGVSPWLGLLIGGSWALYSLIRRARQVPSIEGLSLELVILAVAGAILLLSTGFLPAPADSPYTPTGNLLLLMLGGPITALPLLLFGMAARRLPLTTLGFIQYFGPTLQFLMAVFLYDEAFTRFQAGAYGLIWTALVLFTIDSRTTRRRSHRRQVQRELAEATETAAGCDPGTQPAIAAGKGG